MVVAVVDEVDLEAGVTQVLDVFGKEGQEKTKFVSAQPFFHRLAEGDFSIGGFLFVGVVVLVSVQQSLYRLTSAFVLFCIDCSWRSLNGVGAPLSTVLLVVHNHHFGDTDWDLKSVGVFYQNDIFTSETGHDAAARLT